MLKVAIIAGEDSGDLCASYLMKAIKISYPQVQFVGIGGIKMQEQGLTSWYDIKLISVIGLSEVLKRLPQLLLLRHKMIKNIVKYQPDCFIGVDAPDFTLFIEKKLKQHNIKTIHYISPSLWAWRYDRIYKIKQTTDLMLCLFPFEPVYYQQQKIKVEFVGHPLASIIESHPDLVYYRNKICDSQIITVQDLVIAVLCGSRKHEIMILAPEAIKAANIIANQLSPTKKIIVLLPVSAALAQCLQLIIDKFEINFDYKIIVNDTLSAIKASDIALVKSGTVSLEVALCKKPMVIFYKLQKLSAYFVAKRLKIKFVGLANIIALELGLKPIIPELLQEQANSTNLAKQLIKVYNDDNLKSDMIKQFHVIHESLKPPINYKKIIADLI